jgi:uncharacterized protein (UPF0548 family)
MIYVSVVCRVTRVDNSDTQFGFTYRTLPHHVECGEESFHTEIDQCGRVEFTIRSHSRPQHPVVALGAPVARMIQRRTTKRYLQAMQELVGNGL